MLHISTLQPDATYDSFPPTSASEFYLQTFLPSVPLVIYCYDDDSSDDYLMEYQAFLL